MFLINENKKLLWGFSEIMRQNNTSNGTFHIKTLKIQLVGGKPINCFTSMGAMI